MEKQSPNTQVSPLSSWDVYRQAHKAIWLGTVEATDERDAIEKVANDRNIPAKGLIADAAAITRLRSMRNHTTGAPVVLCVHPVQCWI